VRFFLMINLDKRNAEVCAQQVVEKLTALGGEVFISNDSSVVKDKFPSVTFGDNDIMTEQCDVVISIGGDGTLIYASKYAVPHNKPVLGINTGRLGFLTRMEQNELDCLERLFSGKYTVENRMMLELIYRRASGEETVFSALNDIVLSRGSLSRIVDLEISCDGKPVSEYRADGLVFSTPTGSTAYSLSAGGPVVEPAMECIIMSPICPHSLFARTIVFSNERTVSVKTSFDRSNETYVTIDGVECFSISPGDRISVRKSPNYAKLISFDQSFFEILSEKFIDHNKT